MIRTTLASAALAIALCATAAQAQPRQMTVSLAGLDLSKPADVKILDARIHTAAVDVCGTAQYQPTEGINQFIEDRETIAQCVYDAAQGAHMTLMARENPTPSTRLAASGN